MVEWCLRSHQVPISLLNVPPRRLDATKNCFKVCAHQKYGKKVKIFWEEGALDYQENTTHMYVYLHLVLGDPI